MSLLDITGQQIKSPVSGMGHIYWNCWPVNFNRHPQYYKLLMLMMTLDSNSKTLLLKIQHTSIKEHGKMKPRNIIAIEKLI